MLWKRETTENKIPTHIRNNAQLGETRTRATGHPFDADPPQREHRAVMVDVQERQLIILFSQHEKQTIAEFDTFGEVEPPYCICDL